MSQNEFKPWEDYTEEEFEEALRVCNYTEEDIEKAVRFCDEAERNPNATVERPDQNITGE